MTVAVPLPRVTTIPISLTFAFAVALLSLAHNACGAECSAAEKNAVNSSVTCASRFRTTGVCAKSCCCFQLDDPLTTLFAMAGSCYLERRIGSDDVPRFRIRAYGPKSASECAVASRDGCPASPCDFSGDEKAVLGRARESEPAVGSGSRGQDVSENGERSSSEESGTGGGTNRTAILAGGIVAAVVVLALLVWVVVVLWRRRNVARSSLHLPKRFATESYGQTDATQTLSTSAADEHADHLAAERP